MKLKLFGMLSLALSALTLSQAQTVTVNPQEYTDGMRNPLMGLRDRAESATEVAKIPFATAVRKYIYYNELDNNVNDGVDKIKQYTDANFANYDKEGIKVIVRVILQWSDNQYFWPADLPSAERNYTSAVLRQRVLKTIANMGLAWNNDPRIAWIETGLISKWGEQQSPQDISALNVKPDNKSWAQILGPAFMAAFPNKKTVVRGPSKWTGIAGYTPNSYWDNFASESSMTNPSYDYPTEQIKFNRPPYDRYKVSPQGGEIAYSVGVNHAQTGADELETYTTPKFRAHVINIARSINMTSLGMEFSSAVGNNAVGSTVWNNVLAGARELQLGFGYRFLIPEFTCTKQIGADRQLAITAKVKNDGPAPFYDTWPLKIVLINKSDKTIVWTSPALNANPSTWYPGGNYDWKPQVNGPGTGTLQYLTPAVINTIQETVTIPAGIADGTYYVGLAITDPTNNKPGVFFSVKNFFKASNTQPLAEIGIGMAPIDPTLSNVTFDSYGNWTDDTRSYSLTPVTTYTLTTNATAGGTVSPGSGSYNAGTSVTVTATPNAGFTFSGWSGALTGLTNPATVTMDANKSVTANFTAVATYTLTTNANAGGTVSPGGTYNSGTSVSVTATPNAGFTFSGWTGDLTGLTNPASITMNANKTVTANFTAVATYTLTTNATAGGTVSPGGTYNAGTSVTVTATPNAGFTFSGWSGDLTGMTNPASITMNAAKSVTANFSAVVGEAAPWTESFTYANGTVSHGSPTTWSATNISVQSNEMSFNNAGADGVFTTGAINISAGPVTVSMKVRGGSGLNVGEDFLRLYKKVDGGAEVQIGAADGPQAAATWTANITSGSSLVLVVRAHVTSSTEFYYFDDLSVTGSAPVLPTVTVAATDATAGETTPASNPGQYTFTRTGSTATALTVNFTVSGTATSGSDYTALGTSVTIAAGQASATQTLTVIDDATVESSETAIVTLASNAAYVIGAPSSATVNIADNDTGLPSPWVTADIGAVGAVGSATYSDPTFTIKGSGADIYGTADEFRYVHQSSSGDCSIKARVVSLQNTSDWAKAGVMIRETTAANAQSAILCVTPTNGVAFQYRATTGGSTVTNLVVAGQTAPKWLRLTRVGNTFTAFRSDDGTTWTQVGTAQTINMATSTTMGLAVTSHNDGTLCTSVIDNVTATP